MQHLNLFSEPAKKNNDEGTDVCLLPMAVRDCTPPFTLDKARMRVCGTFICAPDRAGFKEAMHMACLGERMPSGYGVESYFLYDVLKRSSTFRFFARRYRMTKQGKQILSRYRPKGSVVFGCVTALGNVETFFRDFSPEPSRAIELLSASVDMLMPRTGIDKTIWSQADLSQVPWVIDIRNQHSMPDVGDMVASPVSGQIKYKLLGYQLVHHLSSSLGQKPFAVVPVQEFYVGRKLTPVRHIGWPSSAKKTLWPLGLRLRATSPE